MRITLFFLNCSSGDLGNVQIYLNYNRLSRFEETVFQDILQQMAVEGKNGFIDLTSSKNQMSGILQSP